MKYLRLNEKSFDFLYDDVHEILKTDVPISEKDYLEFFEKQGTNKQFRKRENPQLGGGLFGYVEEFIPEFVEQPKSELESVKEQLKEMQIAFSELTKLVNSK